MRAFLWLTFAVLLFTFSGVSFSKKSKDEVNENTLVATGFFSQTKKLIALKRPFISNGNFVSIAQHGLIWHTLSPVTSTKLFSTRGMFSIDENNIMKKEGQIDSHFFLALFTGDQQKLAEFFTITEQKNCLTLLPKSETLVNIFNKIETCFDNNLPSTILLEEQNGNHTEIILTIEEERKITPEELRYFAQD